MTAITDKPRINAAEVDFRQRPPVAIALLTQLSSERCPSERQLLVDRLTVYVSQQPEDRVDYAFINAKLTEQGFAALPTSLPQQPNLRPFGSLSAAEQRELTDFDRFVGRAHGEARHAPSAAKAAIAQVVEVVRTVSGGALNAQEYDTAMQMLERARSWRS